MSSRGTVSPPARWWRRFWSGVLVLVAVTVGVVLVLTPSEGGDPGDAAAIPVTIGTALCVLLIALWGVMCLTGFRRERRAQRP